MKRIFFSLLLRAAQLLLSKTRFLLITVSLLISSASNATHIAGGDLDVQWVSGNNFKVTLKLFRDCANNGANFDPTVTMAVYTNGTNALVSTFNMSLSSAQKLTLGDECFAPPSTVCMEEGRYELTVTLPNNTGGYYLVWERCCRSPLNNNIQQDQGMVFYAQVPDPAIKNSSPKFSNYPANGYFCINTLNAFDFSATDADGDQLVYSLITPLAGSSSTNNVIPDPPAPKPFDQVNWTWPYNLNNIVGGTPNMSINSSTGVLTCTPNTLGAFTFSVKVEEFRSGVKIGEVVRDIQFFSLQCNKDVAAITQTPNNDDTALEGCIKATFNFTLDKVQSTDKIIKLDIKGNAVNGVDYAYLDNEIVIPAGQTKATIIIDAFADGIPEGKEDIFLIYYPLPCNDLIQDTVYLFIDDDQPISYTLNGTDLTCNGNLTGQINATITGGIAPYNITVTDTNSGKATVYSSAALPISGLAAGTYSIEIGDAYGCGGQAEVVGALFDAGQTFLPDGNGQIFSSTLNISGISANTITSPEEVQSICLNMEHSSLGDVEIRLISPNGSILTLKQRFNGTDGGHADLGEPVAKNSTDGGNSGNVVPGVGYDYCFTASPTFGTMVQEHQNYSHTYVDATGTTLTDNYLPSGSYNPYQSFGNLVGSPVNGNWIIEVEDHRPQSNGYIFNWSISFKVDKAGDIVTLNEPAKINITGGVTSSSCNGADGAINISASGVNTPLSFSWSNSAVTEDISGLAAGSYTVTVTDTNSCSNQATFLVPNATGPAISGVVTDEKCVGAKDGSIDAAFTGTITNILWSNGAVTEDISGLTPGTYTVTVTDNNGCKSLQSFTVNAATPINITGTSLNEVCGNKEGEINITVSGGDANFVFSWSNGKTTEDLTDLQQGSYTITVKDGKECIKSQTFSLINEVGNCVPPCDLAINNEIIVNETCGQANGSITLSVFTSNSPSQITWSNGMTGNSLTNLSAGNYTATIIDALNCKIIRSYVLTNETGTLSISTPILTNDNCGQNIGSIGITVLGGTTGYTYSWSNGRITEDISGLGQGTYDITVTDGSGCKASASYSIINETAGITLSEIVKNEKCGDGKGTIDITVSPAGTYSYLWSNGATTQDLTNVSAGSYSCTITSSSGCKIYTPDYTIINGAGTLSVTLFDKDDEVCGNGMGEIDLKVSGATSYSFTWSNGATTEDITGLSAGTYSCTITDNAGCNVSTGDIIIFNTPGTLNVTVYKADESCDNAQGSIDLSITGGTPAYSVSWSNSAVTEDLANLSDGSYTYTVTDQQGCTASASVYIADTPGTLNLDNTVVTDETCSNGQGQIDITISGGSGIYTYTWSTGATTQDLAPVASGTYTCIIKDSNNCEIEASATVNNASGTMKIDTSVVNNSNCGKNNGNISLTVSGGSGTYKYTWSNGAVTKNISNLAPGNYLCIIDDQSGCIINYSATILNLNGPSVTSVYAVDDYCGGGSGGVYISVTGGTAPYYYDWSSGETSEDIANLYSGTYYCTITDAKGCNTTISATVGTDGPFYISDSTITSASCSTCSNGSIDITFGGNGAGFLNYYWSNGEATEDIYNLSPGSYTVYYDNGWCYLETTFRVDFLTGITSVKNDLKYSVYPNPTTGVFIIERKSRNTNTQIEITNVLGAALKNLELNETSKQLELDLRMFDNGVYFINFIEGSSRTTQKLIINK